MRLPTMARWVLLALLVLAIDAYTKSLASTQLLLGKVSVLPFLDLLLSHYLQSFLQYLQVKDLLNPHLLKLYLVL